MKTVLYNRTKLGVSPGLKDQFYTVKDGGVSGIREMEAGAKNEHLQETWAGKMFSFTPKDESDTREKWLSELMEELLGIGEEDFVMIPVKHGEDVKDGLEDLKMLCRCGGKMAMLPFVVKSDLPKPVNKSVGDAGDEYSYHAVVVLSAKWFVERKIEGDQMDKNIWGLSKSGSLF